MNEQHKPLGARIGASDLGLRVVSAIVLIVVALAATIAGGIWFDLFASLIAMLIYVEWAGIALWRRSRPLSIAAGVLLAALLIALIAGVPGIWLLAAVLAALVFATAFAAAGRSQIAWAAGGFAYAGLSGISLALLRAGDTAGLAAIIFLFATVWATDILAYFVGRAIGGPKLAPAISPGKTWSGAIGGLVASVVAGLAAAAIIGAPSWGVAVLLAVILSVASQMGDLGESAFKRRFGVKDSGALIPGHGGVMDRVDGLVAAAMVLFLVGALAGAADSPASALFAP